MTKSDYMTKRKTLLDECQTLIDSGNLEESNEKIKAIDELDAAYDAINQARADFRALYGDHNKIPDAVRDMYAGPEVIVMNGSKGAYVPAAADPSYLTMNQRMVDQVELTDENIRMMNTKNALGETIKGIVTGKWSNTELKNAVTTSTSGSLIPEILSAQIIDQMRNVCLFTSAGTPVYPMKNGNLTIARLAQDPTLSFKAEGAEGTEGNLSFDSVELKAKTIYGYAYLTLEAIKSAENLDSIVKNAFAEAMARAIDHALLYGQSTEGTADTFAPAGIWNDSNIESVAMGTDVPYDCLIKARGKLLANNAAPSCLAINSQTDELLLLQKDEEHRYIPMPGAIADMKRVITNQLDYDSTDGSDALVFDPFAVVIGMQDNITVETINDTECVRRGLVAFRIYAMVDAAVVRPKAICKVTGLKA